MLLGVGLGLVFAPAFSTATVGVAHCDAGVASAMVNTSQQVGGSVGTALLSTLAGSAVTSYAVDHGTSQAAMAAAAVHGYTTAFYWSAAIFAIGAIVVEPRLPLRRAAGRDGPGRRAGPRALISRGMTEPRKIEFGTPVSHDTGVHDAEADVDGTRWALVEYTPGAGRAGWCETRTPATCSAAR